MTCNRWKLSALGYFENKSLHSIQMRMSRALFVRALRVYRQGEFARSLEDLVVQPTYLHKHDAPLCFPFSLRAPYRTFSTKWGGRGGRDAGTRVKSFAAHNATQFHYTTRVSTRIVGQGCWYKLRSNEHHLNVNLLILIVLKRNTKF